MEGWEVESVFKMILDWVWRKRGIVYGGNLFNNDCIKVGGERDEVR